MTDLGLAPWALAFQKTFEMMPVPGEQNARYPIPPDAFPSPNAFTLTAPWVAIASESHAVTANWWTGCYARIQVLLPTLEPSVIGPDIRIPVNRGAKLIQVPDWAVEGYQVAIEFPQWIEQISVQIYTYDPT